MQVDEDNNFFLQKKSKLKKMMSYLSEGKVQALILFSSSKRPFAAAHFYSIG
jgi:hypothetical protein